MVQTELLGHRNKTKAANLPREIPLVPIFTEQQKKKHYYVNEKEKLYNYSKPQSNK